MLNAFLEGFHQTITLHNKKQNNKCCSVFYGGLSGTNLTLWGFLENYNLTDKFERGYVGMI